MSRPKMSSRTVRLRAWQLREERLADIQAQVESGRLVIRQATVEERERYGIRSGEKTCDRGQRNG